MWPEWWHWEIAFTGHAELRMTQRGATEVDVRTMLQRADGFSASVVDGRFMIRTTHHGWPWIVIVEPDEHERKLLIVTLYKASS
jgi:hypothetical protein